MTRQTKPKPLRSVKKFYFLDYFFILLSSVEKNSSWEEAFAAFKVLKQKHRLGESKYKKLTGDGENPTQTQQRRYRYTFKQVLEESKEHGLVRDDDSQALSLTPRGHQLLSSHRTSGVREFNLALFKLMEDNYKGFRTLVTFLYRANPKGAGVLIFPHYSPLELHFQRSALKTRQDMVRYTEALVRKLQGDVKHYLEQDVPLREENAQLLRKLTDDGLLPGDMSEPFAPTDYNKITKRIRDSWITYFLKDLYKCPDAMSTFDLWVYRAKQIGVIHATELHPSVNGKLVYPTSVVLDNTNSVDFHSVYTYPDHHHLYLHEPSDTSFQEDFVDALVKGYFDLRRAVRNYFVNLSALRELVCFHLKISAFWFEKTLNEIYRLNLSGQLQIRISLEVDKLPEETNAMYMKHEPVMVDGSYRNIIAIDVSKGESRNEQVTQAANRAAGPKSNRPVRAVPPD